MTVQAPAAPAESAESHEFESAFTQANAAPPAASSAPATAQPPVSPAPPASPAPTAAPTPAAAAPAPAAPQIPASNPFYEQAKKLGIATDGFKSNDDLVKALLSHAEQQAPFVQLGRQSLTARPQAPPPPAAPAAPAEKPWSLDDHFAGLWKVPEWKPEYQTLIDRGLVAIGERGLYEATDPALAAYVMPLLNDLNEAYLSQIEARQNLFNGNPLKNIHDGLYPAIERQIMARVEEALSGRFEQVQQADALETFEAENKAWLYDATGNFTEHGQKFLNAVQSLREGGMTDPGKLIAFAKQIVPPPAATPAASPAAAPQAPTVTAPPTPQESFLQDAAQRASHSPQPNGSAPQMNAPVTVEESELNSMFNKALSTQRAGKAA